METGSPQVRVDDLLKSCFYTRLGNELEPASLETVVKYWRDCERIETGNIVPVCDLAKVSRPHQHAVDAIGLYLGKQYEDFLRRALINRVWLRHPVVFDAVRHAESELGECVPEVSSGYVNHLNEPHVYFVVSYPRSGNTFLMSLFNGLIRGSKCAVFQHGAPYFSRFVNHTISKTPMFVKDHLLRDEYLNNQVIYLVRDFRDTLLSLNDFLFRQRKDPRLLEGVEPFLNFLTNQYGLGSWLDHVRRALQVAAQHSTVKIVRYEDLFGSHQLAVLSDILKHFDQSPDESELAAALKSSEEDLTRARSEISGWQQSPIYAQGNYLDQWRNASIQNADGHAGKWREVLTRQDKQAIHESGVTELLLELEYERDANWWQSE